MSKKIKNKIKGTADKPRLSVFRSNKFLSAQLIDDEKGHTIVSISENTLVKEKISRQEKASRLGEEIGKLALSKKIKQIVFDRGRYRYHGKIKALAEGARKSGLTF